MSNPAAPPIPSTIAATSDFSQPSSSGQTTTIPVAGASTTIPSPAISSKPLATALPGWGQHNTAVSGVEPEHTKPVEPNTCVIGLSVEEYRPYACDRCGGEQTKVIWLGTLSDVLSANEGFFSESDVITSDDIVGDRLEIILGLQMLARKQGFTHCEVREYSVSDPLKYVPLFSGPLPVPGLAS